MKIHPTAIRFWPSAELRRKAVDVLLPFPSNTRSVLDQMIVTMYAAKGVGLAAPQIGLGARMFVFDVDPREHGSPIEVINPEIRGRQGAWTSTEGCLSIPGEMTRVERSQSIDVVYLTADGERVERRFHGLEACAFQHELDHLNGVCIGDLVGPAERDRLARSCRKRRKQGNAWIPPAT